MTRMAPSFRGWRGSCTPSSKRLRLLRVLDLMLATEGDTKVGAGQSQERGLCRQTENDHHTVHSASRTITELGPLIRLVFIRGDAASAMGSQDDGGPAAPGAVPAGASVDAFSGTLNP